MAFRVNAYDADETNVNRLWDLEANRTNHLKKLETIYKERQAVRTKSQKDHLKRQKQLQKYHISRVKTSDNKNKSVQDKINYENSLLRNKILDIYQKSNPYRKSKSFFINEAERRSPLKMNEAESMYRTNLKIGERLTHIKSEIGEMCKISQHRKKSEKLLEMIDKKSGKRKAYLKSLTKRKFYADLILPEREDNNFHGLLKQ